MDGLDTQTFKFKSEKPNKISYTSFFGVSL